jgi:hypothetical protein
MADLRPRTSPDAGARSTGEPPAEVAALLDAKQKEIDRFWRVLERVAEIIGAEGQDLDTEAAVQMYVDWATEKIDSQADQLAALHARAAEAERGMADVVEMLDGLLGRTQCGIGDVPRAWVLDNVQDILDVARAALHPPTGEAR